ncbi:xylose isomerase-like protein [Aspergillus welwitschiae]|uniref:Xylose isomerase-like protein n=1 Tax=Aspergillus welwitschiae TaxID=1341132 RepID=A0A3F3Q746_9EURO|nr:xylose isomerase-like protein [Aspergillus welwitschiae]RDH34998.1 xylose isomerase-like protein [Aspergillus welwitschiae]
MVVISRFRSLWGIEPGQAQSEWRKKFVELKAHGYAGIEIDFAGMTPEQLQLLRKNCDEVGLEISVLLFSSWPKYDGPRPRGLIPDAHLEFYRGQLRLATILKPVVINAQSGADYWSFDESVFFYKNALEIEKEEGFEGIVCHETHRNRSLFNPYSTDYIVQRVPQLRITADISHWVVVCERLLDQGEEDREILDRVIPHVRHIHARMGTTQSSQCPEPLNPAFSAEREFFETLWLRIVKLRQQTEPNCRITWVPEYGPFPYHPIGTAQTHGQLADSEGKRLETLFESAIGRS